jgi:hypothetical protein
MTTKARTIQSSGKQIEQCSADLKQDLEMRLLAIAKLIQAGMAG